MSKLTKITLEIYGQSFTIRADPDEEKKLNQVADEVNEFLKQLSHSGTVPIHRLALMAAFQYAYELDTLKNTPAVSKKVYRDVNSKIDQIMAKLQDALDKE